VSLTCEAAQPHNSVSDNSLYKHIDPDLPPSARARQLLIWCAARSMARSTEAAASSLSKRKGKRTGKDRPPSLPPLSEKAAQVLKSVQEDVIRMLAERKIDTNVFAGPDEPPQKKKENAQNVRNRECQARFTQEIERFVAGFSCFDSSGRSADDWLARAEDEERAWAETERFYDARVAELTEMAKPSYYSSSSSAKAKGKQRADSDDFTPRINELPKEFHGGAKLALKVLAEDPYEKTPLAQQLDNLQFEVSRRGSFISSSTLADRV
jgi:kinetochore protein Mis13/DSN1